MNRIHRVAQQYIARGHKVRVINWRMIEVTDAQAGNTYRVSASGRAIVGRELAELLASEAEEPPIHGRR